ncbi:hypothetical protein HID58_007322, partial [Brassica napus]
KSHDCPKSYHGSITVSICEECSVAIETTGSDKQGIKSLHVEHERTGDCDPRKRKKPVCPVKRCSESLTFANNLTCKDSGVNFENEKRERLWKRNNFCFIKFSSID